MEEFPANLKENLKKVLKKKQINSFKDWLEKMTSRGQTKVVLKGKRINWLNLIQLDLWTREWVKRSGKYRELVKFEERIG